ncbi:hypothetical protein B0T16DRAFT_11708 [Cercophora newfieldiana]|uniref:Uncharacterized protein n=1 Tax=Cercophora newfieldiana TaxID=92897 RepID=A0AA39YMS8_9PEZI|nr:hypothetical protein B0T16DRAFT_11708 [Cercophora newfieldiana]
MVSSSWSKSGGGPTASLLAPTRRGPLSRPSFPNPHSHAGIETPATKWALRWRPLLAKMDVERFRPLPQQGQGDLDHQTTVQPSPEAEETGRWRQSQRGVCVCVCAREEIGQPTTDFVHFFLFPELEQIRNSPWPPCLVHRSPTLPHLTHTRGIETRQTKWVGTDDRSWQRWMWCAVERFRPLPQQGQGDLNDQRSPNKFLKRRKGGAGCC